jgi:uncharacterized membrane protein
MNKDLIGRETINENRKFQLERISLFSDAVFAIAITLLIIELKIPEKENESATEFLNSFFSITNRFIGFLFSFIFIGMYWIMHHKIFFHLKDFNQKLLSLNLVLLLFIIIMPFSTAIAFEHMTLPDYPFIFYSLNHIAISFCLYLLWRFLGKEKNLTIALDSNRFLSYKKTRSIVVVTVFIISIILAFYNPTLCRFTPILIAPLFFLLKRKYKDVSKIEF